MRATEVKREISGKISERCDDREVESVGDGELNLLPCNTITKLDGSARPVVRGTLDDGVQVTRMCAVGAPHQGRKGMYPFVTRLGSVVQCRSVRADAGCCVHGCCRTRPEREGR